MSYILRHLALLLAILAMSHGRPPVKPKPAEYPEGKSHEQAGEHGAASGNGTAEWDLGIEYNRYLQEVVQVLESDPDFRKKLEDSDVEKIRDGSIAEELKFVNHNLRSKLDDVKRKEVDRLRKLAVKQYENNRGIDRQNLKLPVHIDVSNHKFDIEDLRKLIKSTTNDLEEADRNRRDDFKKYEMEKKFEKEERLKHIENEEARKVEQERLDKLQAKHKDHDKLKHPMTKDQLEDVWEEQDHMKPEDWDPKTFFAMHDLNGDGYWEEDELKVLFAKELDKAYDPNNPEDDMQERAEESERMREHVFKETDANKDRMISFDEFLEQTKKEEFNRNDESWEGVDDIQDDFTDDEFNQFEAERQAEIQAMLDKGQLPPGYPYFGSMPAGGAPYQLPQQPVLGSIPGQAAYNPSVPEGRQPLTMHGSLPGQPAYLNDPSYNMPNHNAGQGVQGVPVRRQANLVPDSNNNQAVPVQPDKPVFPQGQQQQPPQQNQDPPQQQQFQQPLQQQQLQQDPPVANP